MRIRYPWQYNVLELPFHTGQRYVYLPFTMFPGHRGYRAIGAPGGGVPGMAGMAGMGVLGQAIPLINNMLSGLTGGAVKFGAARSEPSTVSLVTNPFSWNPILLGTLLGAGLGSAYMIRKNKKRLENKNLLEKVVSNPSLFGALVGGISGGAFGLSADQLAKFVSEK